MYDALIEQYMPLANKLAFLQKRRIPNHIDVEELKSAAYLGLVEAASRFDTSRGISFTTYAYPRIFGAIKDYLRSLGPICKSLDDDDNDMAIKDTLYAKEEARDDFDDSIEVIGKDLGTDTKSMLRLYFVEDMSMKDVGRQFDVSESRVCQLISACKRDIRDKWTEEDLREELAA